MSEAGNIPVLVLKDPRGDIRDAKMAVMPDGRLMLLTCTQLFDTSAHNHQSIAWITKDLKTWDGPFDVGDPDVWMWGIIWQVFLAAVLAVFAIFLQERAPAQPLMVPVAAPMPPDVSPPPPPAVMRG